MAGDEVIMEEAAEPAQPPQRGWFPRLLRWLSGGVLVLLLLLAIAIAWLHTGSGRQFIADRLSRVAPASGLRIEVGRIEGSVLWSSTLHDVKFRDANGTLFLQVPEVDLNWRPHRFLFSGLDVRHLVLHRGTLFAVPELLPGDPDAPILPNFDIRVDRFVIDDLTVAKGLLGEERTIDFRARADVRDGRVVLNSNGEFGGADAFKLLVDAEPDGNIFDIDLDYRAPAGGFLATMVGSQKDVRARILGDGTWTAWTGAFVAEQGGANIAAFRIHNRGGIYKVVGQARPGGFVTGLPAAALGEVVSLAAVGTLENSVLDGTIALRGKGVNADGKGAIDLGENAFRNFELRAALLNPTLFGPGLVLNDANAVATFDGPFRPISAPVALRVGRMDVGGTVLTGLAQSGTVSFDGARWTLPLDASVQRVTSGNAMIDPRLVNGTLRGVVTLAGNALRSDNLALRFPGLSADLSLRGDIARGGYALAGPVEARGLALQNLGLVDAGAQIRFLIGNGVPWRLAANFTGRMPRVTNATLANIAGTNIRFNGGVSLGGGRPIVFDRTTLTASKLTLTLDGRVEAGRTTLAGQGRHTEYGPFTVEASIEGDGPRATLVFASPFPPAGLKDVRVALAPIPDGFRIETNGQSMLGPFDGLLNLVMPARGPTLIGIEHLNIAETTVAGTLALRTGGVEGDLTLAGGGINGTVALAPHSDGQGFNVNLLADNASFAGPTPLSISHASIQANGVIGQGGWTVSGNADGAGISYGNIFVNRLGARAEITNSTGRFDAALTGRGDRRFDLQLTGALTPDRIAVAARGNYSGRDISMPRRAVFVRSADGGWDLQQTQLSFGRGFAIVEGHFGGGTPVQGRLALADMPVSVIDLFAGELGLGGTASGIVDFGTGENGLPVGEVRVMVDNLTRSGLVLSSRPIDLALVGRLSPTLLQARAVVKEEGQTRGRFQGRIANLPETGGLAERLYAGDLFAQVRYDGPADALWRLSTVEMIDLTGRIELAADVTGTLGDPLVRGSLAGNDLSVQVGATGTDIRNVQARGRFLGSRLNLTSFRGTAPNDGTVTGSGFVDLSRISAGRGPQIDLRMAARRAEVVDMPNMGATVTGPMRIVSNGVGGTIAGRLRVDEAHWEFGAAASTERLPNIDTREINLPPDRRAQQAPGAPWRFLIDANAPGGVEVDSMGLDSEWSGNIQLRGTTDDPRIGGVARVVPRQGFYNFAGNRFELTRGVVDFDASLPIDPLIDIVAETTVDNLAVTVTIMGSASRPEIAFTSVPALPEEELLSRLLFGDSITNLSATDALQLGAALASLQGGGGMDPINQLRRSIGLDRLRIVGADPALNRGTSIALGKNFGRRFYGEIVTDGQGYNATSLEFRVTSWLSLLATINTIGRGSVAGVVSHDY